MNLKVSFSYLCVIVFSLPMLVNIAYVIFPPVCGGSEQKKVTRWIEIAEQISRIVYLIAIVFLQSREKVRFNGPWFWLALCFLVLYYASWISYFIGGREESLLKRSFLFIPMPLVLFPTAYFLCASFWLNNFCAAIAALIFGAAHITVSIQSFQ